MKQLYAIVGLIFLSVPLYAAESPAIKDIDAKIVSYKDQEKNLADQYTRLMKNKSLIEQNMIMIQGAVAALEDLKAPVSAPSKPSAKETTK